MTSQTIQQDAYHNFIIHIRSPVTRMNYESQLKRYLEYNNTESYDDLLFERDTKQIQDRIETFLWHIQNPESN